MLQVNLVVELEAGVHAGNRIAFRLEDVIHVVTGVDLAGAVSELAAAKLLDFIELGTFMNLSGRAVQSAAAFFKLPPESLLVIFDDASLPLGTLRFREGGSHGGHNGARSIIESLGCDRFPRLKIGIGGSDQGKLTGHVLGRFREDERDASEKALARAVDAVQLALSQGVAAAANAHNVRNKPPNTESDESEI